MSNVLRDFPFSQNQPLKSADDWYIRILKNKLVKLKKKQGDRTLWLSHGTCSYIRVYINAAADSVMLCLQHDFCNIIFKIEHKLCIAPGWAPQGKILGAYFSTGSSNHIRVRVTGGSIIVQRGHIRGSWCSNSTPMILTAFVANVWRTWSRTNLHPLQKLMQPPERAINFLGIVGEHFKLILIQFWIRIHITHNCLSWGLLTSPGANFGKDRIPKSSTLWNTTLWCKGDVNLYIYSRTRL
jgi:hypothetical protein